MIDFVFQNPTKIYFGKSALSNLKSEAAHWGERVLLVYGGGSIKRTGVYDQVMAQLAGTQVWELGGVQPNPRLSLVREGIRLCHEHDIQLVLAVGGGSAIDTAKAVANGACYDGDVWDLFDGKGRNTEVLPLGTVVTIPAAGSEMSDSCVITREEDLCKRGRNTPLNFPKFSILNPEFTYTLPPFQTACGVVDIMAHMMERYFTRVTHVELIDRMTEGALKTVVGNAPIVMHEPENYDARAEIMWAGCLAHNTLFQTGRVGDWASHQLEHELGGMFDVAHGAGLAAVWGSWARYVCGEKPQRFAQFAHRIFGIPCQGDAKETALKGIEAMEDFYRSIGMPVNIRELGCELTEEQIATLAEKCCFGGRTIGLFKVLGKEDIREIYRMAKG